MWLNEAGAINFDEFQAPAMNVRRQNESLNFSNEFLVISEIAIGRIQYVGDLKQRMGGRKKLESDSRMQLGRVVGSDSLWVPPLACLSFLSFAIRLSLPSRSKKRRKEKQVIARKWGKFSQRRRKEGGKWRSKLWWRVCIKAPYWITEKGGGEGASVASPGGGEGGREREREREGGGRGDKRRLSIEASLRPKQASNDAMLYTVLFFFSI